jgi:uncharacterized integral membrane protein
VSSEGRSETELERLDRNLTELMGEVRVALPGIQVLLAFLLILPFNARFADVSDFQEGVYFATLAVTMLAVAFLVAPSVQHRIGFRIDDKAWIVQQANRQAIVGLGFLLLALTGMMLLISDFLFPVAAAVAATGATATLLGWLWFVRPLARRRKVLAQRRART